MSGRWESPDNNTEGIDFDEVFSHSDLDALKLISMENIVDECKKQNDKITQKLIAHTAILEDLLDICVRPSSSHCSELGQITNEHTYKALEIVTNINTEEFSEYLMGIKHKKAEEDDIVVTQDHQYGELQPSMPLIVKLFAMLKEPKPLDQTPLWYMYKIGSSLCYQKPKQLLNLFKENQQLSLMLFEHFYSNSILQWVIKILQVQDSSSFFQAQKTVIFFYLVQTLEKQQKDKEIQLDRLSNFQAVMGMFLEKMEDRFDKSKYISLSKAIFSHKQSVHFVFTRLLSHIQQLFSTSNAHFDQMVQLMIIAQKYLHFSANFKPSLLININNSISYNQNSKSQSNIGIGGAGSYGNSGLDASVVMDIVLDAENLANARLAVQKLTKWHIQNKIVKCKDSKDNLVSMSVTLSFLKLLKSVLLVTDSVDQSRFTNIITPDFVRYLLTLMTVNEKITLLHNVIKDILIESICKNYEHTVRILLDESQSNFLQLINQIKGRANATKFQYENQIYHVFQTIFRKGEEKIHAKFIDECKKSISGFEVAYTKILEKQRLYATLIGGNPRKQSSCWGDSSQDDKLFPFNFNNNQQTSDKKLSGNHEQGLLSPTANDAIQGNTDHWFDCGGLPLDSDQSKDDLDNNVVKSQGIIESNSPVQIRLTDGISPKNQNRFSIQSQLAKRFKNIGIVECQQQEIRIPMRKDRYSNSKNSNSKGKNDLNEAKSNSKEIISNKQPLNQLKDKQEMELENQIKKLQDQRHHRFDGLEPTSPQIKLRIKKKVDSLEQEKQVKQKPLSEHNVKTETIDVSGILDLSNSKDKVTSNNKIVNQQGEPTIQENKSLSLQEKENKEAKPHIQNQQNDSRPFPTYLSFQIEEILAELE